jgi:hypothetical protein
MTVDLVELAGLDETTRAHLLDALSGLPATEGPSAGLTAALRVARDALRERHPIRGDQILVDVLCRLDPRHWAVEGWSAQPDPELFALTPEGETVRLGAVVDRDGRFAAVASTRSPSTTEGWVVLGCSDNGVVETPELGATTREQVLAGTRTVRFGPAPMKPQTTVVVLLDPDGELLEHHLVWFETDTAGRNADLVCVLDGPQELQRSESFARQLHDLYARPMTLVVLPVHAGRRMMCEAGAAHAVDGEIRWSDWPGRFA